MLNQTQWVLEKFKTMFPQYDSIVSCTKVSHDTIEVDIETRGTLIFCYRRDCDWYLQTKKYKS